MSKLSRKAFAVEQMRNDEGVIASPKIRLPQPSDVAKLDSEHFLPLEESDYLMRVLGGTPYATYVTDGPEAMQSVIYDGYAHTDGSRWKSFFAFWREQRGHVFLVPEESEVVDLTGIGVHAEVTGVGVITKIGKGANRVFSPQLVTWGNEVSYNKVDDIAVVRLDLDSVDLTDEDKEISVRYVPLEGMTDEQKALADGTALVSEKAVRLLGLNIDPKRNEPLEITVGMAWRFTLLSRAFAKGHIQFKPELDVDLVVYGPKPYLSSDQFFFGNMGALHVGDPSTDRQAFINFGFHRDGLAYELAVKYIRQVWDKSKDEMGMRQLFRAHADLAKTWLLPKALMYGISFLRYPALFRRVVSYLAGDTSKVFQTTKRQRIPMDSVASYGYVLTDLSVFDSEGGIHPEWSLIPEGHMGFPDLKGGLEVAVYRQPSGHSNEHVIMTISSNPAFKPYAGRGICLVGRGADKMLGRLGGADLDDALVIVHDKVWVAAFKTLRKYPETKKLSEEVVEVSDDDASLYESGEVMFVQETTDVINQLNQNGGSVPYGYEHVRWQIEMSEGNRTGLGSAVIYGMFDMLLSDPDHKASMLADLESKGEMEAYQWLVNYEEWQAAKLMTNLETVIDGTVKDPTLLKALAPELSHIRTWHEECRVYPESMQNKIPAWKVKLGDYALAKSLMCRTLDRIKDVQRNLLDAFSKKEYEMVVPADVSLRGAYPLNRKVKAFVGGEYRKDADNRWVRLDSEALSIKDVWAQEWERVRQLDLDVNESRKVVLEKVQDMVKGFNDLTMEAISVELYYLTYNRYLLGPRTDPFTGERRNFNDALLWSPVFADHFIMALRKARLTGLYLPVDLFPEFRRSLLSTNVVVEVRDHVVYMAGKDGAFTVQVGAMFDQSYNGKFTMYSGLVEFRKPQPICLPVKR